MSAEGALRYAYVGMRNRAISNGLYAPGYRFFEIDLLVRLLRDLNVLFWVADPNYGICGKTPSLNGAPEIAIVTPPPAKPESRGLAIWVCGTKCHHHVATQDERWIDHLRSSGWECCIAFLAEDVRVDLRRLGYE